MRMATPPRTLCFTLLLLALTSCGVEGVGEGALSPIDLYFVSDGEFAVATRQELTGTGTVVMTEPLPGTNSSDSYHLRINLLDSNSSVTLVTHAVNQSLQSGIRLTFSTPNSIDVDAEIEADGRIVSGAGSYVEEFYSSDSIDVFVDVHMDGSDARVLVWNDRVVNFQTAIPDLDSEINGNLSLGISGTDWGLILDNATVTFAQLDDPKLEPQLQQ